MQFLYNVGDEVVLLDGRPSERRDDPGFAPGMERLIGQKGKIIKTLTGGSRYRRPWYKVAFNGGTNVYTVEEYWIEPVYEMHDSPLLDKFFEEWGDEN